MRSRPNDRLIELVSVALGQQDAQAAALSEGERHRVEQLQVALRALATPTWHAPASAIASAVGIMPARRRHVAIPILAPWMTAGARRVAADEMHLEYRADALSIRVTYVRESTGWRVLFVVPGPDWQPTRDGQPLETDGTGRFEFVAADLDQTAFALESGDQVVEIPALGEGAAGGLA